MISGLNKLVNYPGAMELPGHKTKFSLGDQVKVTSPLPGAVVPEEYIGLEGEVVNIVHIVKEAEVTGANLDPTDGTLHVDMKVKIDHDEYVIKIPCKADIILTFKENELVLAPEKFGVREGI